MKVKDTIAFIGNLKGFCPQMAARLANNHHPIVLVGKEEADTFKSLESIRSLAPEADITPASCAREGCWEADIIILPENLIPDEDLMERIKTVSNQKVVVSMSSRKDADMDIKKEESSSFSEILPHTRWVRAKIKEGNNQITLWGEDSSVSAIKDTFAEAGYAVE